MLAPVKQLRKNEIEWLASNRCRHYHTYLEHYSCFLQENPEGCPFAEKTGFFDIETSNLNADWGYMFSYSIKERGGDIIGRVLTQSEIRRYTFDRDLIKECCEDLRKFHRIIVYYGSDYRFDIPFCRVRAIKHGCDFPLYKEVFVQDVYSVVKAKLKLHRNRMETACDTFGIPTKQHRLVPDIWMKALAGHEQSLDYIWQHNKEDVVSLELLWNKLEQYVLKGKRSI